MNNWEHVAGQSEEKGDKALHLRSLWFLRLQWSYQTSLLEKKHAKKTHDMHMNQANLRLKLQRMGAYQWPLDLQLTDQAEADIKATAHQ